MTSPESGRVTDVAKDEGGGDGPDPMQLGQGGARSGDGDRDTALQPGDVSVEAADVADVLACQTLAFDGDEVVGAHATQDHAGVLGAEAHRRPAGQELPEQHVQSTHRLGARRGQCLMAVGEHAHHRAVLVGGHSTQPAVAQPGDGGGQRVVGVVLGGLGRAEQPDPRRQGGWDVDDVLAGGNQLLGQQTAEAGSRLDRPGSLHAERLGPRQEPLGLASVGGDGEPGDGMFVAVDGDGGVGRLVRVDPDGHGHGGASCWSWWDATTGTPDEGLHASFEPRRDRAPTGWRFVHRPTRPASGRHFKSQPIETRGRYEQKLNARLDLPSGT
ncbi:MAG: hypothetical protein KY438_11740 [Actinobacteria bacterium]|nr:hypothetical protein [Actinomycetota bacterium]